MPFDPQERRMGVQLAGIIDNALDLAEKCGWRYAIAYLISEEVPSQIIQRLLSGGGRTRRPSGESSQECALTWKGADADHMKPLFDWLSQRRTHPACDRRPAQVASRPSAPLAEID